MKSINILENSKEFFESLSIEEFDKLLNRFGFEYEDISNYSYELKLVKKYIQNIKINNYTNRELFLYKNEFKEQKEKNNIDSQIVGRKKVLNDRKTIMYSQSLDIKKILNDRKTVGVGLIENKYDTYNVELGAA